MTFSCFEERINTLESRLAFQEAAIEQFNAILIEQQMEITRLHEQIRLLAERLRAAQPLMTATLSEEMPPPHY